MNSPDRKGKVPVEATQELQALDVVEIEALMPKGDPTAPPVVRKATPSNSSIAPVGLDLGAARAEAVEEEANATMQVRIPTRRRRLRGIVAGAVAGCAVILLAAAIARVSHASGSSDTPTVAAQAPAGTPITASPVAPPAPTTATSPAPTAAAVAPAPATTAAPPANDVASTGTVKLVRPAVAGRVWLDGKKLTSPTALVSCGTHQIKVGFKARHSIDVPCGGEIAVGK